MASTFLYKSLSLTVCAGIGRSTRDLASCEPPRTAAPFESLNHVAVS